MDRGICRKGLGDGGKRLVPPDYLNRLEQVMEFTSSPAIRRRWIDTALCYPVFAEVGLGLIYV